MYIETHVLHANGQAGTRKKRHANNCPFVRRGGANNCLLRGHKKYTRRVNSLQKKTALSHPGLEKEQIFIKNVGSPHA